MKSGAVLAGIFVLGAIIVLLVIPRQQKLLHIRTLADVARVLGQEGVRDELVHSAGAKDAFGILTRGEVEA